MHATRVHGAPSFQARRARDTATMTVSSHVDRSLDFAQYRTFDWGPSDALPTGDPRLDGDPFFRDHVQGAVERGLAARRLELVASGTPDLLIHYHASSSQRIDVNRTDQTYGYSGAAGSPPDIISYEAGTIVVDFIDPRTNRLVWRGWAQTNLEELLRDRERMAETIERAIDQMLRQLPPIR
jgi:hypothetical protein